MHEQREWLRVEVNMSAKVRIIDGPARYENVQIIDMHHQGCCLEGRSLFEKNQTLRIVLEIPFEGMVDITGDVMWAGAISDNGCYRTGLRFKIDRPVDEEVTLKLYHFCLVRAPKR